MSRPLAQSIDDRVKIFVGLKLYRYRIEDIDIVVIGHFAKPRPLDVEYKFYPREGEPFIAGAILYLTYPFGAPILDSKEITDVRPV